MHPICRWTAHYRLCVWCKQFGVEVDKSHEWAGSTYLDRRGGILLIYWGCEYFFSRPFSIRVFPLTLASNLKKYADVGKAGERKIDVTRILLNERKGPVKYKANASHIRVFPRTLALMINNSREFFPLPPFPHPRFPPHPRVDENNSREFFYLPALPASAYPPGPSSHLKRNPRNFFLRPIWPPFAILICIN